MQDVDEENTRINAYWNKHYEYEEYDYRSTTRIITGMMVVGRRTAGADAAERAVVLVGAVFYFSQVSVKTCFDTGTDNKIFEQ